MSLIRNFYVVFDVQTRQGIQPFDRLIKIFCMQMDM